MSARTPIVVDFAPHAIHYAGRSGDLWFVSLEQEPLLLALDDEGRLARTFAFPNVVAVKDGVAFATTRPRVPLANVKQAPSRGPWETIAWDLQTERELWRKPSTEVAIPALSADARVEIVPGGMRLDNGRRAFGYVENPRAPGRRWDWRDTYTEANAAVVVGSMRVARIPFDAALDDRIIARVVPVGVGELPLERGKVFFVGTDRLLVEHPTRGRLWFDVANTGLAKGNEVDIGGFFSVNGTTVATILARNGQVIHRAAPPMVEDAAEAHVHVATQVVERAPQPPTAPDAVITLVGALAAAGFLDPMSPEQVAEIWTENFSGLEVDETTAGNFLSVIHSEGTGPARGVVAHDVRFGNETNDVVAELAATLGSEPIVFAQEDARDDAVRIRAGDRVEWVSGGLHSIVRWMNSRLDDAGATRRIHQLPTGGDDSCFVVCDPKVFADLAGGPAHVRSVLLL